MPPNQLPLPLKDIHLPDTIGWWPPAIGWWLLAILIPLVVFGLYRFYKHLTRKTAIKVAKKNLELIKLYAPEDIANQLRVLSILIRRVSMSFAPRSQVASLTGQAWLAFLDKSVSGNSFTQGPGRLLTEAAYRKTPPSSAEVAELLVLCETWLKAQSSYAKRKKS